MHTTVNVNPRLAQYLLSGRDEVSVFAERLQLGYLFDGSKVFRVRTYPNLSLVGFSFDCTAWFEIDDVKLTSLTFQPVLRLRLHSRDPGGPEPHRIDFMGDDVINKGPFWQPALTIDLTRVPDRGPRTSPPGP
ncbi:MAG TPA: hypothetical protein VK932_29910, partial [Kofleriaceae bacterium]|nr:hypothetical protein [Kofleriaceae bacterium]